MDIKKAVIEICGSCNYKCTFCPQSWDGGREKSFKKMMNFDLFTDALDQLILSWREVAVSIGATCVLLCDLNRFGCASAVEFWFEWSVCTASITSII